MTKTLCVGVILSVGLLPLLAGCSGTSDTSGASSSLMTAEQACLATHTDHGVLNFSGTQCQVCGAGRTDTRTSFQSGALVEFPVAKFGLSLNVGLVSVRLTDQLGAFVELTHAASASTCGSKQAWFFDDPQNPTKIGLCNCESMAALSGAVWIDVLVGCAGTATITESTRAGESSSAAVDGGQTFQGGATTQAPSTCASAHCGCATGSCGACTSSLCSGSGGVVIGGISVSGSIDIGGSIQFGGSASGTASAGASGTASGSASGTASAGASGTASGSASGTASGSASGTASGSASGTASGSASGTASGSGNTIVAASATGCSSLWNVLFSANGCTTH